MPRSFGTTPHCTAPDGTCDVWFTDPPGMFVVMRARARLNAASADWLATKVYAAIDARFPGKPLCFIHDVGAVVGYETAARVRLNAWAVSVGRERISHVGLIVAPQAPMLVRMGASMATLAMSLLGVPARVYQSRTEALVAYPVAALADPPILSS